MNIIFECHHCHDYNKHNRDDKDYEWRNPEIQSFSDAHRHMLEFPNAWIDIVLREYEEE